MTPEQIAEAREGLKLALRILGRQPTPQEEALLNPPRSGPYVVPQPPTGDGKVTEEQWQRMSHGERLDYARRFSNGGGRS